MRLIVGDITTLVVDAIVNAANPSLIGGGVDGAIHRAAGWELAAMCATLPSVHPGQAVATPGYGLPARHVIHAVGPVWRGGAHGEADVLRRAYLASLDVAAMLDARTVAFPAISTGVYGFPAELAARIAVDACRHFPGDVIFCCLPGQERHHAHALADHGA